MRQLSTAAAWLLAGSCLLGSPAALGARLPEWAAAIAEEAQPVEHESEEDEWHILLSDTRIDVQTDGSLLVQRRIAAQALQARPHFGVAAYHFDDAAKIIKARAWHLGPSGKARRSRGPVVDVTVGSSFLTDQKARIVPLKGVVTGSLAFFEFEVHELPETLTHATVFHEGGAVDVARLSVRIPPDWTLRHDWLRIDGPEPEESDGWHGWELQDLPGHSAAEPLGESASERAPMLVLAFGPPSGGETAAVPVATDWTALAAWYEELARGKHEVTPEIRNLRDSELTGDLDLYERILTAGSYVRSSVRYVAQEIGIGAYQPRPAEQVLFQKHGDCKDKGTLLRSLLAVDGIESYPILVNASRERTVSTKVPAMGSFNHFVVGVPLPREVEIPAGFVSATLDLEGVGPLLIVDTTDDRTAIGSLPGYLSGKRALLVAGDHSRLIEIPGDDATAHRIERSLSIARSEASTIRMIETSSLFGEPAARARSTWRESPQEYRKEVASELDRTWPGARVEELQVNAESELGAYEERLVWQVEQSGTERLLGLFPTVLDDLPRVSLGRRETAVVYRYPITLRCETTLTDPDEQAIPPAGQEARGDGWSVVAAYSREKDELVASFELELSRRRFEPADFGELRRFWNAARRAANVAVR